MTLRCKGFKLYRLFVNVMFAMEAHAHSSLLFWLFPPPIPLSLEWGNFFLPLCSFTQPSRLGWFSSLESCAPVWVSCTNTWLRLEGEKHPFYRTLLVFNECFSFGLKWCLALYIAHYFFYFFCTVMSIINVIIIVVFACSSNCQHDMQ